MRQQSKKKQRERRQSSKLRDAMKERLGRCEWCRVPTNELEEHHIAGGCHRSELANPRTLVYLCHQCHEQWQGQEFDIQANNMNVITRNAINEAIGRNLL